MIEELSITNLRTGESASFGKTADHSYLIADDGVSIGTPSISYSSTAYPKAIGENIEDVEIGRREFSLIGWVVYELREQDKGLSTGEIENLLQKRLLEKKGILSRLVIPNDEVRIDFNEYFLKGKPSSPVQFSSTWRENNDIFCKYMISVTCGNPMFQKIDKVIAEATEYYEGFKFPFQIPENVGFWFAQNTAPAVVALYNPGDVPVGLSITMKAVNGSVWMPEILDVNTGERISMEITLHNTIKINTSYGKDRKIVGIELGEEEYTNFYKYWKNTNVWLQAPPGESVYAILYETGEYGVYLDVSIEITPEKYIIEEA